MERSEVDTSDKEEIGHMFPNLAEIEEEDDPNNDDESSSRGTKTLEDTYARCKAVALEPTMHVKAASKASWRARMQKKIAMIEKV